MDSLPRVPSYIPVLVPRIENSQLTYGAHIGTKRKHSSAGHPTLVDTIQVPPRKRQKRNTGTSPARILISEDSTATEDNTTARIDERYEAEIQKVYKFVNNVFKGCARLTASKVVEWALPVARRIDEIQAGDLYERFSHFQEHIRIQHLHVANSSFRISDCRNIWQLAKLMQELLEAYRAARKTFAGASINAAGLGRALHVLAGYCVGEGGGLESSKVLGYSISGPYSEEDTWGYGRKYYTNLTLWFSTIFLIYGNVGFVKIGKRLSTSNVVNKPPHWVLSIINMIRLNIGYEKQTEEFLLDRIARRQPWIRKNSFGKVSNVHRCMSGQIRAFHLGIENIPAPIARLWLVGHHRTPGQAVQALATGLGFSIQRLWYHGERPPPIYTWLADDFPERRSERRLAPSSPLIHVGERAARNANGDLLGSTRLPRSLR